MTDPFHQREPFVETPVQGQSQRKHPRDRGARCLRCGALGPAEVAARTDAEVRAVGQLAGDAHPQRAVLGVAGGPRRLEVPACGRDVELAERDPAKGALPRGGRVELAQLRHQGPRGHKVSGVGQRAHGVDEAALTIVAIGAELRGLGEQTGGAEIVAVRQGVAPCGVELGSESRVRLCRRLTTVQKGGGRVVDERRGRSVQLGAPARARRGGTETPTTKTATRTSSADTTAIPREQAAGSSRTATTVRRVTGSVSSPSQRRGDGEHREEGQDHGEDRESAAGDGEHREAMEQPEVAEESGKEGETDDGDDGQSGEDGP